MLERRISGFFSAFAIFLAFGVGAVGAGESEGAPMPYSQSSLHGTTVIESSGHLVLFSPVREIRNEIDRKSTRLNSSHVRISYAVFCLKKKKKSDRSII